jgi:excisionase family DNA binding protein
MTETPKKLLLTIHEVSFLTGIAVGTLYHWVSEKRIPVVRISARCIRFDLTVLQKWIEQKTCTT